MSSNTELIKNEIFAFNILSKCNSPFIVKCYNLQNQRICLYCNGNGGMDKDFLEFMNKRRFFIEEEIIDYFL